MPQQAAKTIMMVRPKHFGYDHESASSNGFQKVDGAENAFQIQQAAAQEFDTAVEALKSHGVDVRVIEDTSGPIKPNAVFPNNWVSFHGDRTFLYPMMAVNRRAERRSDLLDELEDQGIDIGEIIDFSVFEKESKYLESTGSLILDYENKLMYACRSNRTHPELIEKLCEILGFEAVVFDAYDREGLEIYHTNVMMCLAQQYVVICLESIPEDQRPEVEGALKKSGHEIVPITFDQMYSFAGNMLEVENEAGQSILVMSKAAMKSLSLDQKERLSQYSQLLSTPIPTIEKYGGGSIRCMMCRLN